MKVAAAFRPAVERVVGAVTVTVDGAAGRAVTNADGIFDDVDVGVGGSCDGGKRVGRNEVVGIDKGDKFTASMVDARIARGAQTAVLLAMDYRHATVGAIAVAHRFAAVGRTIVDEYDFKIGVRLAQQRVDARFYPLNDLIDRHNDAYLHNYFHKVTFFCANFATFVENFFAMAEFSNDRGAKPFQKKTQAVDFAEGSKLQPQDREVEEAVLGALMLERDAFGVVCDILKPESFYDPQHQKIYEAIQALGLKQEPIDMLTVVQQLRLEGRLDEVGGALHISELTSKVVSAAHIETHARIVAQKFLARQLIEFCSKIAGKAFDESYDVDDLLQEAEGELFGISQNNLKKDFVQIDPVITEAIEQIAAAGQKESGLSGLATGFHKLDKLTSGWQNSDLIIIAARPAMGKTAFVLSMAKNMAVDYNTPVALFSLEMSNVQLVKRLICNVCELEGDKIKSGKLTQAEWDQLQYRVRRLFSAPLFVDDTAALSIFELRTKARRLVREHGVKIIIIDYLQLMNANGMKFGSREQEVSTISRSLKQLAKELNIPIIALSQLSRKVEDRKDSNSKRPQLSDLRESGAIEQDADIVCFIHRPEYYMHSSEDSEKSVKGKAEFIVAKHRNGAVDDVEMRFVARFARFQNWEDSNIPDRMETIESRFGDDNSSQPTGSSIAGGSVSDVPNVPGVPDMHDADFSTPAEPLPF